MTEYEFSLCSFAVFSYLFDTALTKMMSLCKSHVLIQIETKYSQETKYEGLFSGIPGPLALLFDSQRRILNSTKTGFIYDTFNVFATFNFEATTNIALFRRYKIDANLHRLIT